MHLLLAPHNDDEVLFTAFTIMRHYLTIHVVVCLRSFAQPLRHGFATTWQQREDETAAALAVLGVPLGRYTQWDGGCNDHEPDWDEVRHRMIQARDSGLWRGVFAPFVYEEGGNPQHDMIGNLAAEVFGPTNVTRYHTYIDARTRGVGTVVEPPPGGIRKKLQALACYESQLNLVSTSHHFMRDLTEYYA